MKVITKGSVVLGDDYYSNLDGNSSKEEILAVQKLINSKGEKLVDETGVFDAKTAEVYNKYKTRIDREMSEMGFEPIRLKAKPITTPGISDLGYVPTFPTTDLKMKKTSWWSKRTTMQKGLVIGGAVVLASIIGFVVFKKKK
jgi:hypothetical protein